MSGSVTLLLLFQRKKEFLRGFVRRSLGLMFVTEANISAVIRHFSAAGAGSQELGVLLDLWVRA